MASDTVNGLDQDAQTKRENQIDDRLRQLRALLCALCDHETGRLEAIGSEHVDTLMWLASDMADEIAQLREDVVGESLRARGIRLPQRGANHA